MRRMAIVGTAFTRSAVALLIGVGVEAATPEVGASSATVVVSQEGQCLASFIPFIASVGEPVHLNVTGLGPGESVTVTVDGSPANGLTADSSGKVAVDLGPVPPEWADQTNAFTYTGDSTGTTCSALLTVAAIGSDTTVPHTVPTYPTQPPVQQVTTPTAAVDAAGAASLTPAFTG